MTAISVLIVEDDPRIAELHRRFTERVEGFKVVGIACALAEAAEMVELLEPDLILLDLYFPDGDSFGLLNQVRAAGAETDVILITAAHDVKTLKTAMRNGVFDFIIKPISTARFAECLDKYRNHYARLETRTMLEQGDVDGILHAPVTTGASGEPVAEHLPKGIDALTLDKIRAVFETEPSAEGLSAEDVGARIGVSRSTARRYLEYLVSVCFVRPDLVYGAIGRPERRYAKI